MMWQLEAGERGCWVIRKTPGGASWQLVFLVTWTPFRIMRQTSLGTSVRGFPGRFNWVVKTHPEYEQQQHSPLCFLTADSVTSLCLLCHRGAHLLDKVQVRPPVKLLASVWYFTTSTRKQIHTTEPKQENKTEPVGQKPERRDLLH